MALFLEIVGTLYLFAFGLRVCYTLGYAYESMIDIIDENKEEWAKQSLFEKLQAYIFCVISMWVTLPMMWVGSQNSGGD